MHLVSALAASIPFHPPTDANSIVLIILRWIHFLAGITWIGLLYFFNLVNVPFMKEMDAPTKGKVVPSLMPKALWWFRWGAIVTVLAGIAYWMILLTGNVSWAHTNGFADAGGGAAIGSFFGIWTVIFAVEYAVIMVAKVNKGPVLAIIVAVLVIIGAWLFLRINSAEWQSNNVLSIGIGGGLGWIMMLNVWGIIWRNNKKVINWTRDNALNGTPIPPDSAALARMGFLASRTNAWLSLPMLFFMASASHFAMFGR